MTNQKPKLSKLYSLVGFDPNDNQKKAINTIDGPLLLTAGPGSGKTRVLLWRTLNLIVYNDVKPDEIFLATFTEKAASGLKDGLRTLLALVTNITGQSYDISKMALGTVHSICKTLITDRRFTGGVRKHSPILMDALSQYFKIYNHRFWIYLCEVSKFKDEISANKEINGYFGGFESESRHYAVTNVISLFNRFSEESLNPEKVHTNNSTLSKLIKMYRLYIDELNKHPLVKQVDFSLLQKMAFAQINSTTKAASVFKYIIIDEYQDTNAIQEKIFFALAQGNKNICVVGDDDQALYRFRGATVENLVDFSERCKEAIGIKPQRIDLDINYRSRKEIVDTYTKFISLIDWKKQKPLKGFYRIHDKNIQANSSDKKPSVIVSNHAKADSVYKEIAEFIYRMKKSKKIEDYSQCAFLFPAMKNNARVSGFRLAFESLNEEKKLLGTKNELKVYAPRAGRFLEVEEARAIWGLMLLIFDRPHYGDTENKSLKSFRYWLFNCMGFANQLCAKDELLKQYVEDRKSDLERIKNDYDLLLKVVSKNKLNIKDPLKYHMLRLLSEAPNLSLKGKKNLSNQFFANIVKKRELEGKPFKIEYIINRATSVDWSILDLFYQLNGFRFFRDMYSLAQNGLDEGPVCNLGLVTQYLSRFMEEYSSIITGGFLKDDKFAHSFFSSYTYALYRLGESEYEDAEDPFPKGRVSFLTLHQAKGLEFPVVIVGSVFKKINSDNQIELIIRKLLKKEGEPLDRISLFDNMRMFYVGLSRAKNLLILPKYTHAMNATEEFKKLFDEYKFKTIDEFDFASLPREDFEIDDLGKSYSYTADYLNYEQCPRQYMIMRKYGFVASRSQTMLFGSLVHQSIEDLHQLLINERLIGVKE